MQLAAQLRDYGPLIWKRAITDLRHRYAATALGPLWTLLHPLALIATYSLIFGLLRGMEPIDGVPFPIVLCAGLLPWLGFTECIMRGCSAFRVNRTYLKKLSVPEPVYVGQAALTATFNMLISLVLLVVAVLLVGVTPSWTWLLLPLPLAALMLLGLGIGLALGTVNAFVPDVQEITPVVLRVLMWIVPVILPFELYLAAGDAVGYAVAALPPTGAIHAVRELLVFGRLPEIGFWVGMVVWTAVACAVGSAVLDALRAELRDVL